MWLAEKGILVKATHSKDQVKRLNHGWKMLHIYIRHTRLDFMETRAVLRIVVASPGDVQVERESLVQVVDELNRDLAAHQGLTLELIRWETHSHPGFHEAGPNELIGSFLDIGNCDVFIGIFWKRFGAGTEDEFRRAIETWKERRRPQIMFYFSQAGYAPQTPSEAEQWKKVLEFKENFPREGLWWDYNGASAFPGLLRSHLAQYIRAYTESRRFFILDSYDVLVQVEPLGETRPMQISYGLRSSKQSTVVTDNRARIRKTVTFSSENRNVDRFELSYQTRNPDPGRIVIRNPAFILLHDETADPRRSTFYDDNGTDLCFQFTPRYQTYSLDIDVYKGFDQGHRNLRCYLGELTQCRFFRLTLDLSRYVTKGSTALLPSLHYFGEKEPGFHASDNKPPLDRPILHTLSTAEGIWRWDLENKRGGVVYLQWDST